MSKNEMLELAFEYNLFENENDLIKVSYAMNEDEFADFIGFLFLGDWSRNISVLDEETRSDKRVQELFEHIEAHCE